jgi:type II secretory ATPase GspE/PulE/Tfp pilus assembly ATPase PilB-like protein
VAEVFPRLAEMGIAPFLSTSGIRCLVSQRLLRRLCECKQPGEPNADERALLERALDDAPVEHLCRPAGCEVCGGTGYKGRVGTHELLKNTDALRALINKRATTDALKEAARAGGMRTLFEDLMEKVKAGLTALPEALGTARPDDTPNPLAAVKVAQRAEERQKGRGASELADMLGLSDEAKK